MLIGSESECCVVRYGLGSTSRSRSDSTLFAEVGVAKILLTQTEIPAQIGSRLFVNR